MGWPKGKPRRPIEKEEKEEEMKKNTPSPVINKRQKVGEMSGDATILLARLETYRETFVESQNNQCMHSEITNHLEEKIGKEKNGEVVTELHTYLETLLEARNEKVSELNAELDELAETTTIYTGSQEDMLVSMDKMDVKQLHQFSGFLTLASKKCQFLNLASTIINPEYEKEELIYTALCEYAENNVKGAYKPTNRYRVRIAPRAPSNGRGATSSSSSGANPYTTESQETVSY